LESKNQKKEARHMIDVSAVGRAGRYPTTAGQTLRSEGGFGAALDATRQEAAQRKGPGRAAGEAGASHAETRGFVQPTDLAKLRLEAGSVPSGATLADHCRAALDALEAGDHPDRARECLRQAYAELVQATEESWGFLPHDSLPRILAMAEYAQNNGGHAK